MMSIVAIARPAPLAIVPTVPGKRRKFLMPRPEAVASVAPGEAVMAGNSLRSDIWPALQASAWAVHLPHEFEWARERADDPEGQPRFARLGSIRALPGWIDATNASLA